MSDVRERAQAFERNKEKLGLNSFGITNERDKKLNTIINKMLDNLRRSLIYSQLRINKDPEVLAEKNEIIANIMGIAGESANGRNASYILDELQCGKGVRRQHLFDSIKRRIEVIVKSVEEKGNLNVRILRSPDKTTGVRTVDDLDKERKINSKSFYEDIVNGKVTVTTTNKVLDYMKPGQIAKRKVPISELLSVNNDVFYGSR